MYLLPQALFVIVRPGCQSPPYARVVVSHEVSVDAAAVITGFACISRDLSAISLPASHAREIALYGARFPH